jgi:hypothetical protein
MRRHYQVEKSSQMWSINQPNEFSVTLCSPMWHLHFWLKTCLISDMCHCLPTTLKHLFMFNHILFFLFFFFKLLPDYASYVSMSCLMFVYSQVGMWEIYPGDYSSYVSMSCLMFVYSRVGLWEIYTGENVNVILENGNFNFMLNHNFLHKLTDFPVES